MKFFTVRKRSRYDRVSRLRLITLRMFTPRSPRPARAASTASTCRQILIDIVIAIIKDDYSLIKKIIIIIPPKKLIENKHLLNFMIIFK